MTVVCCCHSYRAESSNDSDGLGPSLKYVVSVSSKHKDVRYQNVGFQSAEPDWQESHFYFGVPSSTWECCEE